jgi:glycosyltransferase involved in cell wall biosynthesis
MNLSVLMPVFNERDTLEKAIARVRELKIPLEIVCVDDLSTDGTREMLERLLAAGQIDQLALHPENRGKGAAIRTALALATGDIVVIQDADLEYDPSDILKLIGPIMDGRADAVIGSRFRGDVTRVLYYWHSLGNKALTTFSNMLTNLNLTDMESCYKLVKTDLMKSLPLTSDRFGFEPELTARLAQARARIYEMPISYSGRTYAEGKKIRWTDGVAAFWHIMRFNLFSVKAPVYFETVENSSRFEPRPHPLPTPKSNAVVRG